MSRQGKRPVPKVPGPSSKFNTNSMGGYKGSSNSKSPTGSRPSPKVASGASGHSTPTMNKTKPAVKHKSMGAPRKDATTGASKKNGG